MVILCALCTIAYTIYGLTPTGKEAFAQVQRQETETTTAKTNKQTKNITPSPFASFTPKPTITNTLTPTPTLQLLSPTATQFIDGTVILIMNGMNLNQEKAESVFEIAKSIGIFSIGEISFLQESDLGKEYTASVNCSEYSCLPGFIIIIHDGQVYSIQNLAAEYYNKTRGGILDQVSNYILDISEESNFKALTITTITPLLKSPSSARFPIISEWSFARNKDIVTVQSYVDADNSFGSNIRTEFTVQFSYNNSELTYLQFGDQIVFGLLRK
jgi:hypothetical protein